MNIEKYTERARGFIQSAQTAALGMGHQQFAPVHLLKVLLDDDQGMANGLIERAGGDPKAARAGVENMTRTLAVEWAQHNIQVNAVAPGPTRTDGVLAEWGETNEELGRSLPLGRTADPTEIAEAVLFLASPAAGFLTGTIVHVDGGGTAL